MKKEISYEELLKLTKELMKGREWFVYDPEWRKKLNELMNPAQTISTKTNQQ